MDALDINNAAMSGVAKYVKWKQEFIAGFKESIEKGQVQMAFAMMPPAMKEAMKKADPQAYERIVSELSGQ